MYKIIAGFWLILIASPAFAVGSIIVSWAVSAAFAATTAGIMMAMAINMIAASIISKAFFSPNQPGNMDQSNPGNRSTLPAATDNKLPIVYGQAYAAGTVIDVSISNDNQDIYYVIAISEVTNNGADTITFGDIYYGGKKAIFNDTNLYSVDSLLDGESGQSQEINGKIKIYLYSNGSFNPANSDISAVTLLSTANLVYNWDSSKLMTNTAFAVVHLTYNRDANITGLEQLKFQITNSRHKPGDCFLDYFTNTVYGAAIPLAQIDTDSLDELNTYCDELVSYTTYDGPTATQTRFRYDGVIDTNKSIMTNLQDMSNCCDCLIKYNEIMGTWGVVVQKPTYSIAMNLNDSNMISAISITPLDIASSYNIIECKFPDNSNQDAFNTATFDLAQLDPELLYSNEPVNKQTATLPLVNDSVRAQILANRMLKASREDLQVQVNINYIGLELEAGDIVTITNTNYGWVAKEFRINKIVQEFGEDGTVIAKLTLSEFNATVYNDSPVTQFTPAPNTGISSPLAFGFIPAPTVAGQYPTAAVPLFTVNVTGSTSGIIQYAEVWYAASPTPAADARYFAATTAIQSNGNPYPAGTVLPSVEIVNLPSGDWYFFSRMVNSLGTSPFSSASSVFRWRPRTFQYIDRYLVVAYADSITGTGFNLNPRNKTYYGLLNQTTSNPSTTASDYSWYLADPAFGTTIYLAFTNRTSRRFSFATGFAGFAAGTGTFIPTQFTIFDPLIWSALPDGTNYIDLDHSTGQVISTGTTTTGTGEISIINNPDGRIVASLSPYLADQFGPGVTQVTSSAATITVDVYGRVVGFTTPDSFYYTKQSFTATSGQTVFTVTRASGYISGQCLVFKNGALLDTSEYTDTGGTTGTVTLGTGATVGDIITIISMKSSNSSTGVYASFTRNTTTLTNASSYTPSFTLNSGYELLFLNGTVVNDQDYDIVGGDITNFPAVASGLLTVIQFSQNNLNLPNGNPQNILINTIIGQVLYSFSFDVNAFNLYQNGVILLQGTDYTTATGTYTLTNTPNTILNILQQQTFQRTGAV